MVKSRFLMARSLRFLGESLLLWGLLLAACTVQPSETPIQVELEHRHFPETGFGVDGQFLQFYERYGGGESLGLPISAEFDESGWRVQYFEYGRLEYHPENDPAYHITVGWLGDILNRRHSPIPSTSIPAGNQANFRYYSETGHTIRGDFLHYFDTHGGNVRFGLPISEPFLLDGQLVQDFQSARFFWTPEAEQPVALEEIGRLHLEVVRTKK